MGARQESGPPQLQCGSTACGVQDSGTSTVLLGVTDCMCVSVLKRTSLMSTTAFSATLFSGRSLLPTPTVGSPAGRASTPHTSSFTARRRWNV